jgi:hypothetical protein
MALFGSVLTSDREPYQFSFSIGHPALTGSGQPLAEALR